MLPVLSLSSFIEPFRNPVCVRHSSVVMETVVSFSCFSQAADPDVDYVIKVQIVICLLIKETIDLIS